jgi:hypothetical protein
VHCENNEGKQLKGTAQPGSDYCYDHCPPSTSTVKAVVGYTANEEAEPVLVVCGTSREKDASSEMNEDVTASVEGTTGAPTSKQSLKETPADVESIDDEMSTESSHTLNDEVVGSVLRTDVEVDELEREDEGENLQHLREVFEVDDHESDSENGIDDCEDATNAVDTNGTSIANTQEAITIYPSEWAWDMPLDDRWSACQTMMEELQELMKSVAVHVKTAVFRARKDLQRAKILAKTRVYENKSVIGGTMVGCISRLESIRATRPFAVVVEEASEVLEPLLFSCLSESTVKLEMIGDHRQLRPSVMSRFDFELINKIDVSMFQRLIEAPSGHEIPSTVLSVQRRMRKNICDLTRSFYADVTEIEDHETCNLQVIGQRLPPGTSNLALTSSSGGREVPGIGPHVYLWTHDGAQKKAQVGVSRINQQEATMTCSLVAYLVECGVPRSSIVVLTPYKGQLMLIRNMLLKDSKYASSHLLSKDPQNSDVCRLSTVDRFQGDEEDIVVCSLVVDEKSNTGFVKLVNRMIVLLSRARLGLYILGNVGYFDRNTSGSTAHWGNTFRLLKEPSLSDSTGSRVPAPDLFDGVRTGHEMPLCCPVHRSKIFRMTFASALRLGFCNELCKNPLPCGHACSLRCHWPKSVHNTRSAR